MPLKLPQGIQTFSVIRQQNCLYVDKTPLIHDLIERGSVYFLSRPRRFGRSLLLSTLESLFRGQRELFEGLYIDSAGYDFVAHPVIKLDFSWGRFSSGKCFQDFVGHACQRIAKEHGIDLSPDTGFNQFIELVKSLHVKTGRKVVFLVDEYDRPLLQNLRKNVLEEVKRSYHCFYSIVKSLDRHFAFIFVTGISKLTTDTPFSGIVNWLDISEHNRYANLCGLNEAELMRYFSEPLVELAKEMKIEPVSLSRLPDAKSLHFEQLI